MLLCFLMVCIGWELCGNDGKQKWNKQKKMLEGRETCLYLWGCICACMHIFFFPRDASMLVVERQQRGPTTPLYPIFARTFCSLVSAIGCTSPPKKDRDKDANEGECVCCACVCDCACAQQTQGRGYLNFSF